MPTSGFRVGLAAMPWSIFNRPSLQLGVLKRYVEKQVAARVDVFHPYLLIARAIGTDRYSRIALSGWAGEALFAPLVFPEMYGPAKKLFYESLSGEKQPLPVFDELIERIDECCKAWLNTVAIGEYRLFGLSVCFFQLLPSLYLAKMIKKKRPELPIVFGGSSCSGALGRSLVDHFTEIDYLVDGEGEEALSHLCRYIAGETASLPATIRSRLPVSRENAGTPAKTPDDLPYPDFSPYFEEIRRIFADLPFIPTLPVEFSRGCSWNRCTFCNLNLQWHDYRFKKAERMAEEILHLAAKHESLHFAFADNTLPLHEAEIFFDRMASTGLDLDFFAETRTNTDPQRWRRYRRGGLRTVQIGIEALSTTLLKKMAKGTTVIDAVAAMKMCSASAIVLEGNLITEFPTSTEEEVAETLTNLEYLLPFPPLQAAVFFLGFGSPVHARGGEFAIRAILPHIKNRRLFPPKLLRTMTLLMNGYRGDRRYQHRLWRPVTEKIKAWQAFHRQRGKNRPHPLHYIDGRSFLIIRQERPAGPPLLHRLRGLSRKIYLFCEEPRKKAEILTAFSTVAPGTLDAFLAEMSGKLLMFLENDRVLSLAVRRDCE